MSPERFKKNGLVWLVTSLEDKKCAAAPFFSEAQPLIGVLEGSGIGVEVIDSALQVLTAAGQVLNLKFEVRHGGLIGEDAILAHGKWLPRGHHGFLHGRF